MILTQQEREKFIAYLEQQAKDSHQLVKQMEKMPSKMFSENMINVMTNNAVAFAYVAAKLRAIKDC